MKRDLWGLKRSKGSREECVMRRDERGARERKSVDEVEADKGEEGGQTKVGR